MSVCSVCGGTWDASTGPCTHVHEGEGFVVVSSTGAVAKIQTAPYTEELAAGTLVGDYKIEKMIGQGGMGIVYGARHPVIGKRAAIKVLNAKYCADRAAVERFVQEAQSVNQIGHANIVDIFAFGALEDGRSYLVMEWLAGETLQDRIERSPGLTALEAIAILIPLTRALEAAHLAGVIHRDLKPENVFLIPEEDGFRIKLLDFGIAKLSSTTGAASRTATGVTMGTPLFMSPEQARGSQVDAPSDIYSLGALAYTMLCGSAPFEDEDSVVEVLHAHISKSPRSLHELDPQIPVELDTLILALLAKAPADRPPIVELRRQLKRIAQLLATGVDTGIVFDSITGVSSPVRMARESQVIKNTQLGAASTQMSSAHRSSAHGSRRWAIPAAIGAVVLALSITLVVAARGRASQPGRPVAPAPAPSLPAARLPPVVSEPQSPPPPAPLAPRAPTASGTLELVVVPASARVVVDGEVISTVRGRARIDLAAGEHAIEASAAGYRTFRDKLTIDRDKVVALEARLQSRTDRTKPRNVDGVVNPFAPAKKPTRTPSRKPT